MANNKFRLIRVIRQIGFAELKVRISPAGFGPTAISLPLYVKKWQRVSVGEITCAIGS